MPHAGLGESLLTVFFLQCLVVRGSVLIFVIHLWHLPVSGFLFY